MSEETGSSRSLKIVIYFLSVFMAFLIGILVGTFYPVDPNGPSRIIAIDKYYIQFSLPKDQEELNNMVLYNAAQAAVLNELKKMNLFKDSGGRDK